MSDYLWDKSGEADGDVERLEELLGRLRHAGAAPELPLETGARAASIELESRASTRAGFFGSAFFSRPARLAAAAGLLLAMLAGAFVMLRAFKTDGGRASVNNETQGARPQPTAPEEVRPPEEAHAPQVASSPSKESATPEKLQREPLRRNEPVVSKSPVKSQGREPAPRETVATRTATRDVRPASSQGGVFEGRAAEVGSGVRAKEQLVYALRLTSDALKEVRGRAKGVSATNAFDGRSPLR
jgi:hypothetical protein